MDRQMCSTSAHLSGSGGQAWADSHVHPCRSDPFCFLTSPACSLGPENKGPSWTDSVSPLWGGDRAGLSTGQVFAASWPLTHKRTKSGSAKWDASSHRQWEIQPSNQRGRHEQGPDPLYFSSVKLTQPQNHFPGQGSGEPRLCATQSLPFSATVFASVFILVSLGER